jgi:hypothetical protein
MSTQDVSRRVLERAAARLGGAAALAAKLGIGERVLSRYLEGRELVPDALFLRAVDIVLEQLPEVQKESEAKSQDERRNPG